MWGEEEQIATEQRIVNGLRKMRSRWIMKNEKQSHLSVSKGRQRAVDMCILKMKTASAAAKTAEEGLSFEKAVGTFSHACVCFCSSSQMGKDETRVWNSSKRIFVPVCRKCWK